RQQYNDIKRLRLAYEYLARVIAQGNEDGRWSLDIPSTIVSVPRSNSSRNHQFFKAGIEAGKLYQSWLDKIEKSPAPPSAWFERLADVLISATYYGGLANPRALTCLANTLINNRKPLQSIYSFIWIDLIWASNQDALNYQLKIDGKTSWQTLHRFYLDNQTLGLLLSLYKCKQPGDLEGTNELEQNDVWSLIKDRLLSVNQTTRHKSLRAFCSGAQSVTEVLPQVDIPQALLECASGRVGTTSLLPEQLHGWFLHRQPAVETTEFDFRTVASSLFIPQLDKQEQEHPQKDNSLDSQKKPPKSIDGMLKRVSFALRVEHAGFKRSSSQAVQELNDLLSSNTQLNVQVFIHWLLHCLATLKVSSVYRYYQEIAHLWLYRTETQELDELDESELEHIYEQILASKTDAKAWNYLHGRLRALHQFASEHYGLPALNSFFSTTSTTENQAQVRVGYITEDVYQAMLKSLGNLTGLEQETQQGLKILLILAYRTGMRRGELLKLRLSDIEESEEAWIYVVNNRYGNNKTDSARRKIPTYLLLLPEELQQFKGYIGRRRSQNSHTTNTLVFSDPHAVTIPHSGTMVSNLIKYLLSQCGLDELTFHHLRHSALTNLMFVMHGDNVLVASFTGYTSEHADKIRQELYCVNPESRRDIYHSVSGLAGHLTPETTFLHYLHEVSFLFWDKVQAYNPALSVRNARYFSGLSMEFLNKHLTQRERDTLQLLEVKSEIVSRLKPHTQIVQAAPEVTSSSEEEQLEIGPTRPVTVTDCYSALNDIENGESVVVVAMRYALKEQQVLRWFENAQWLQELKTSRGNQRLFSSAMKPTVLGLHLLPAKIQDRATAAEVDQTINQLRALYGKDKANTLWCIQYWIYNSSLSKAGVRFTDPSKLELFINTLHSVIPYARWQLKLLVTPKSTQDEIKSWRVKGITKPVLDRVKTGKSIQAYLILRHTDEKNMLFKHKRSLSQYSSTLLRYVFHMLAIMIGISPKDEYGSTTPNVTVDFETSAGEEAQAAVIEATQTDSHIDNSVEADVIAQSSSLSELVLDNQSQQAQSQKKLTHEELADLSYEDFMALIVQ
ncbi:MAG: site-specific integrase, partial [Pseudomonas sp.]|nr:site-specific integrase [Pseudomonas sp.]